MRRCRKRAHSLELGEQTLYVYKEGVKSEKELRRMVFTQLKHEGRLAAQHAPLRTVPVPSSSLCIHIWAPGRGSPGSPRPSARCSEMMMRVTDMLRGGSSFWKNMAQVATSNKRARSHRRVTARQIHMSRCTTTLKRWPSTRPWTLVARAPAVLLVVVCVAAAPRAGSCLITCVRVLVLVRRRWWHGVGRR